MIPRCSSGIRLVPVRFWWPEFAGFTGSGTGKFRWENCFRLPRIFPTGSILVSAGNDTPVKLSDAGSDRTWWIHPDIMGSHRILWGRIPTEIRLISTLSDSQQRPVGILRQGIQYSRANFHETRWKRHRIPMNIRRDPIAECSSRDGKTPEYT